MHQYRSKPTMISAYQLTEEMLFNHLIDGHELPEGVRICGANYHREDRIVYDCRVDIQTTQGERVKVTPGEWIVREPDGNGHYPVADEIFRKKYEAI